MPSGARARFAANVAAIGLIHRLGSEQRPANVEDQRVLAGWSGWGALADVFDTTKTGWDTERAQLRELLSVEEWAAAERTTINAHYTNPALAASMWKVLQNLGFGGGRVLEPGCGAGTFIGLAPREAVVVGVELDAVTARIASALYPHAEISTESFVDTPTPPADGLFDAVIGNVPFANVQLFDPVHNPGGHSMHNHFIAKSLALCRPGGLVVVLTSHYTLDAKNPAARRDLARLGELIAAVRLPSGAHRRTAGTEAITDLLILRRHTTANPPEQTSWEQVTPVTVEGGTVAVNRYFVEHPEHVLGTMTVGRGMYRDDTLVVTGDLTNLPTTFAQTLDAVAESARSSGLTMTDRPEQGNEPEPMPTAPVPVGLWAGSIVATDDRGFATVSDGRLEPLKVPETARRELRALIELRDSATSLLDLETTSTEDSDELETARRSLLRAYERYVARWGPLGRYTLRRTGRRNDTGDEVYARTVPTAIRLLRSDPFGPVVLALEEFDDHDQAATPAAILTRRVVAPHRDTTRVDTPSDAVAVSLDRTGGIDLDLIATLLDTTPDQARAALGSLVFSDPESGKLVHAPTYLSGDVRAKLDAARTRAAVDPTYTVNEDALRAVLPADLGIEEITAQLGAVWISAAVHQQFLAELLRADDVRVENPLPGMWEVRGGRYGVLATSEWGTARRPAPVIAQAVMEQKPLLVHDEYEDPEGRTRRVLNAVETAAVQEKAEALQERFSEWVWEDPHRAAHLVAEYNRRFNSIVLRDYTGAGDYLTFPGMASGFTPRPHQRAAVARMIAEPAAGLFHDVGAGKTAEMIIGATEMKRIGLITKPVVVVPNHMLDQFMRDWLHIYPTARILAASSPDLTPDKRRQFVARVTTNDWDAIVMTQGAFTKIPVSPATEAAYIGRQVDQVRAALSDADGERRLSVKRIQRRLLQLENKLKGRLAVDRDDGVAFEATGIDYVIVDEIHMYKNLATESNIRDAGIAGSERATDLHLKLEHLRSTGRERIATGATATPISNSITEAYVMQRYLRPDLLDAAGLGAFDAWAATFGTTVTQMEMAPTGNTFRMKTRFARFRNVPEMLRMWSTFADVKTGTDLHLPTPNLTARPDGQRAPETVAVPATDELEAFITQLGERADAVARGTVTPDEDNMLSIATDGRKAALDIRMATDQDPSGLTKVDVAAETIWRIWQATADNHYLDPATGEPSLIPGALQLVFCDIGTPNTERWNAYDELHTQLTRRGMPPDMVRYMHHAATDLDKARLFAAARGGHIAVLIGSTAKMGVGTNVQARAVALHHLDCPWRPSDIAQREGRILRQGNQNPEVAIVRYVTEGSFDAYMWQGVERKARFITQVMRGRLDTRDIDEIDTTALSAAEAKAISSGNPLLLEHSKAQNDVARLERLERAHHHNQAMLTATLERANQDAARTRTDIAALEDALTRIVDTSGDKFYMSINGTPYSRRRDAAQALATVASHLDTTPRFRIQELGVIGQISSFDIHATSHRTPTTHDITIRLTDIPGGQVTATPTEITNGGIGVIQRIENRVAGIPSLLAEARTRLAQAHQTSAEAQERIGAPFRHTDALDDARHRLRSLTEQLASLEPAHSRSTGNEAARLAEPECDSRSKTSLDVRERRRSTGLQR